MICCIATYWVLIGQNFFYYNRCGKMPSDKASICSPTQIPPAPWCHLPSPYPLIVLQHLRPNKDWVIFIAIKKEKAVTLNPLLPCVYDSYLLTYGCPGSRPHGSIVDLAPFFLPCHSPWPFTCLTTFCKTGYSVKPLTWLLYVNRKEKICFAGSSTAFSS